MTAKLCRTCFILLSLFSSVLFFACGEETGRIQKLSQQITDYSVDVKEGDRVIIMANLSDNSLPVIKSLIEEIYKAGGMPFLDLYSYELERKIFMGTTKEHMEIMAGRDAEFVKSMDCCIMLDETDNACELSDVPEEKLNLYHEYWEKPVIYDNLGHLKWCYMQWPNKAMAQSAGMSLEGFEDFFFKVCSLDYAGMEKAMEPLVELMEKTDRVHITGPGTDISFSIKGIPAVALAGHYNLPDGEILTAPVKDSVNGVVTFNTTSSFYGTDYDNICLEFKDGRVIKATANLTEELNNVLKLDDGSSCVGEFAFGVNPYIENVMNNILFDEKIKGSFHIALGNCYEMADNGNSSSIHWDIISIQTPEYGGGEIWFDDTLIRKDGLFVLPELEGLNPEHLIGD